MPKVWTSLVPDSVEILCWFVRVLNLRRPLSSQGFPCFCWFMVFINRIAKEELGDEIGGEELQYDGRFLRLVHFLGRGFASLSLFENEVLTCLFRNGVINSSGLCCGSCHGTCRFAPSPLHYRDEKWIVLSKFNNSLSFIELLKDQIRISYHGCWLLQVQLLKRFLMRKLIG